jgi:hypothetical protein
MLPASPPHSHGEGYGFLVKLYRFASPANLIGMLIGVLFRSVFVVLGSVQGMAMGDFGMMGCFFMMPSLRMLGGFSMVPGGMFVMFSSFLVVFVNCVLFHDGPPRMRNS